MKTWWVVDEDLDDDRERVHLNAISREVIPPCEIIAVVKLADVEALEKIAQAIDDENAALERRVKELERSRQVDAPLHGW